MTISRHQLYELLTGAKSKVRLLGVVAMDADWESLVTTWASTLKENPQFQLIVLCESDNMLFSKSFTCDTEVASERKSFRELKFVRDRAIELTEPLRTMAVSLQQGEDSRESRAVVEIMHLGIPVSIVQIDERLFANLWLQELTADFEEILPSHRWRKQLESYVDAYCNPNIGRKYSGDPRDEVLELYDHDRIPRGIYPRRSFYDTDYSQLVVWALIFDRRGRLLIHRRARNAHDNRAMWDKSVGGHADFSVDVDTSRAVLREVIEELFSEEVKKKTNFTAWTVSDEEMIYLGEWRSQQRGRRPFDEIRSLNREWAYFRLRGSQRLYSPRLLPNGVQRRLRVIADVFVFVAGAGLTDESLGDLKNSQFKLIDLSDLKNALDKSLRNEPVPGFDAENAIPRFTPDLTNIMTGELRDALEEFSQYVKRYIRS